MKLTCNAMIVAILCAAVLGGCSSQKPAATSTPQTPLPRNPKIDAYVSEMRADVSNGKIKIIEAVMNLSSAEAKVFWPIYRKYESELFKLGDQRVDLIRRFAAAQTAGTLADADATALADGYFSLQQQQLRLLKDYHDIIAKELSPVRAAQFTQIEHRVGTIVDLSVAAETPLVRVVPSTP